MPPDYKAPDFTTSALQHTNVKLSWDAGDDERERVLQKRLNDDAIKDNDFKVSPAGCPAIPAQCCCTSAGWAMLVKLTDSVPKSWLQGKS